MTLRYTLVKQLHYLGQVGDLPVLVTMQRWDALRAASRRSDFIILNDGVPVMSKRVFSAPDLRQMDGAFADTEKQYAGAFFTEADARDLIRQRTGVMPADRYCANRHCGAAMPLASQRCERGHGPNSVGTGAGGPGPRHTVAYPIRAGGTR